MSEERFLKIITMELTTDCLKLEEELELTINSNIDVNEKIKKTKDLLSKIAITEASILKFTSLASTNNNNNEN